MSDDRNRKLTNINEELREPIEAIAQKERRKFTQMVNVLLEEALANRGECPPVSVEQIKSQLYAIESVNELFEVISIIGELAKLRMREQLERQVTPRRPGNAIARLAQKHLETCRTVFATVPNGEEKLEAILQGQKPSDKELVLLRACIPNDLTTILNQEFNGQ